ncbi:MAG: FAD-dependent oxidoreductase [Bacillota bacterium]
MKDKVWDLVVVGGGPAGLTAALYGARSRLSTLVLEKGRAGGQAATTTEIENYPGVRRITGPELMDRIADHARDFGADFVKDDGLEYDLEPLVKSIKGKKGTYRARAVILAPGAEPRVLGVRGERQFRGKGVSYCATCDADFYTGLDVVVVGSGDAALEEAMFLAKFARKVSIIVVHEEGVLDATGVIQERAVAHERLEFIWNSVLEEIRGEGLVEEVVIKNLKTGELSVLSTSGVFFFVGTVPRTSNLGGQVELDDRGYIITGEHLQTSVPGVFAAGDARVKFLRQVVTACSDGAEAAVAAERYLAEEESFHRNVLESEAPVAVAFWSPAVDASLALLPVVEKATAHGGSKFRLYKIDTYRHQQAAGRYRVEEVPELLVFAGGKVVARFNAAQLAGADPGELAATVLAAVAMEDQRT